MTKTPKVNSEGQKELDKAAEQFEAYDENIKSLTQDRMNAAPKHEHEPQTKISQKEMDKAKDIYLKPEKTVSCRDKFNEDFREEYNHKREYVHFTAENREIIGEAIEMWTRPFGGMPAEFWRVPVNKPVWGPRYLAEQLKNCVYHRLKSEQNSITSADGMGQWQGQIVVDTTIQRLDAIPVSSRKSIFMGASGF
jgi:hypothetical protein